MSAADEANRIREPRPADAFARDEIVRPEDLATYREDDADQGNDLAERKGSSGIAPSAAEDIG